MNPAVAIALKVLVVVVIGVVAVWPGSIVVTQVLTRAGAKPDEDPDEPLRGGRWIGRLERLAVFASLLAGFPEGVAVVLAVKSLARYPELRATDSAIAEKFIIGTFTSVLVAAGLAGLTLWIIGLW
jgi:F0F1-type ATP synthase membrane subunit c/vacuolar-type H+-ATPase subunit K